MALEPVEIDFTIGGNIESKGKDVQSGFASITKAAKNAQEDAKKAVQEQVKIIKQIEKDIAGIEKQLYAAAPGKNKDFLSVELSAAKKVLGEEKIFLSEYQQKLEQTGSAAKTFRTQTREMRDELASMEQAGLRGTAAYDALQNKLGAFTDQMSDTAKQAAILADDQKGFRAAAEGLAALSGAMTAATAIASIFTNDQKELEAITQRLQVLMGITIGLQQVANALNKDSYVRVVLVTKAKQAWTVAEKALTVALFGSNVAAKALMATLTGGLAIAIPVVISLIDKWRNSEKEKAEETKKLSEAEQAKAKELAESYGAEQAKIQALRAVLDSDNISRREKIRIIGELKKAIPGYTAELDKEGNVIRENKKSIDEYLASLEKTLRYHSAEKELEKLYSDLRIQEHSNSVQAALAVRNAPAIQELITTDNSKKTGELQMLEGTLREYDKIQKKIAAIKKEIADGGLIPSGGEKIGETVQKAAQEEYNAVVELQKQIEDIRNKSAALQLKQQENSLDRRLEALRLAEQKELTQVTATNAEIVRKWNERYPDRAVVQIMPGMTAEEQSGILSGISMPEATEQLAELKKLEAAYTNARIEQRQKAADKIAEIESQITENSLSEREKELAGVEAAYKKMADELAANFEGKQIPDSVDSQLTTARREAEKEVNLQYDLQDIERERRVLDLKAELNLKSLAVFDTVNLQKLQNERQYNDKAIAEYQKFGDKYEVEMLELQVRNKQIQEDNLKQIDNIVKKGASNIGSIADNISTAFSAINDDVGKVFEGITSVLDGFSSGGIVGGIASIINSLFKAINSIGKKQEERDKKQQEAAAKKVKLQEEYNIALTEQIRLQKQGADGVLYDSVINEFNRGLDAAKKAQKDYAELKDSSAKAYRNFADAKNKDGVSLVRETKDMVQYFLFLKKEIENFDSVAAKKHAETIGGQNKEWQQNLESLIAYKESYETAVEQMNSVVSSLFGSLGDSLGSSLIEGFKAGEDGLAAFEKSFEKTISDMIDSLVTNMIVDALFSPLLDQYSKEISEVMTGGNSSDIAAVLGNLSAEVQELYGGAISLLEDFDRAKIDAGLPGVGGMDAAQATTQSGIAGAFQTMSQDTADILTGQFTAIRQHTTFIPVISQSIQEQTRNMATILAVQYEIANNTGVTAREIQLFRDDFARMRTNGLRVI